MRKRLFAIILALSLLLTLMVGCAGDPLTEDIYTSGDIYVWDGSSWVALSSGGVLAEVDPVFTASDAFPITAAEIAIWNSLVSSQWVTDANGIHYSLGSVGFHTNSSATQLVSMYSSDGISNDPVLWVGDNSASVDSTGIRVNMAGAKTDYTDGIYVTNICTTNTAGSDKFGVRIRNTGNWLGAGSVNYGLYIEEPTGGTTNVGAFIDGLLDMSNNTISNVVDPTLDQDAATKKYVDDEITLLTNYAEMYRYNSAVVTTIQQVNDWHLVTDFTTGEVGGGWSFHSGSQLAITAQANNGDGKTLMTCAAHGLVNLDIISISGTTSYDGVWVVEQVIPPNTFVIDTPWVADEGAITGEHGGHFTSAAVTSAGKYLVNYSISITPASPNCRVEATIFLNDTQQTKSTARVKLAAVGDYLNLAGYSIVDVATDDYISLAIRNITDAGDFTVIHGNMTLVKWGD